MTRKEIVIKALIGSFKIGETLTKGAIHKAAKNLDPNISPATTGWQIYLSLLGKFIELEGKGENGANIYRRIK